MLVVTLLDSLFYKMRAAFRVHGPQQVYRAETMACAVAPDMANEGDKHGQ